MKVHDPDYLVGLVLEVVPLQSCLIFCPTKKHCENVSQLLAKLMPPSARTYRECEKDALTYSLTQENTGLICPVLKRSIRCGVAYHHSGLTTDERLLIEEAYLAGTLCCLVCTSTLAAGVNLPAKRVIVRAPYIGTALLTATRYKQMIGRAGRAGMSDSGESILILKPIDVSQLERVLMSSEEEFSSALEKSQNMQTFLLGLIAMQVTSESEAVIQLISCSLFAGGREESEVRSAVDDALNRLKEAGMITIRDSGCVVTDMGRATCKSAVGLMFSSELYGDLQKSLKMLSLKTHLHLLYLVTPYHFESVSIVPDVYFRTFLSLHEDDQHAAALIGVNESLVTRLVAGRLPKQADPRILPRFYLTLIMYDLWKQQSIWEVAEKYGLHRGTVHSLLTSAAAFGSCVSRFCQELPEFWALRDLMPSFVKQLSYCVSLELVALMELPAVKRGRARQLYNAGYKTLADVAKASPLELVEKIEHLPRRVAHQMVAAAKMLLLEKVEALQEEAQEIALAVQ